MIRSGFTPFEIVVSGEASTGQLISQVMDNFYWLGVIERSLHLLNEENTHGYIINIMLFRGMRRKSGEW